MSGVACLEDTHFHLGGGRTIRSHPKARAPRNDGFTLGFHEILDPADVHYPNWEMHPAGDELLVLLSGALAVEWRDGGASPLCPGMACIVPAGRWHRLILHAPARLIAITPQEGTRHASDQGPRAVKSLS